MDLRLTTMLTSFGLAALVGTSAQATMIAGWDFSQYAGDGFMSTDGGGTFTNTLDANYSDLDPTFGAGAESAAFGTMYVNGQFGSTNVNAGSGTEEFVPSGAAPGSLSSNLTAPARIADFDALTVLLSEGQATAELLAMLATQPVVAVFEADLTSASLAGSNWSITFGAKTFAGTSSIGIEFSSDGVSFAPVTNVNVNTTDTAFNVALGAAETSTAYVRLTFNPVGINQPFIDNVAFNAANLVEVVPEPSTALLGSLGLIGLGIAGRRRSARD